MKRTCDWKRKVNIEVKVVVEVVRILQCQAECKANALAGKVLLLFWQRQVHAVGFIFLGPGSPNRQELTQLLLQSMIYGTIKHNSRHALMIISRVAINLSLSCEALVQGRRSS